MRHRMTPVLGRNGPRQLKVCPVIPFIMLLHVLHVNSTKSFRESKFRRIWAASVWCSKDWDDTLRHRLGDCCTQREYNCYACPSPAHLDALVISSAELLYKPSNTSGAGLAS